MEVRLGPALYSENNSAGSMGLELWSFGLLQNKILSPLAELVEPMRILLHHANGNDTRKEHPYAARIAFFLCGIGGREFCLPRLSQVFQFRATYAQGVLDTNHFSGVPPNYPSALRGPRSMRALNISRPSGGVQ